MIRLWFRGYRNIVTWYQGIIPEESYMRHHSFVRKWILEKIEGFVLQHSKMHIFVSDAMRKFYESKYGLNLTDYYVMPCFNTSFNSDSIKQKDYSAKVFAYIGALSRWQCIDQTLELYARIEKMSGYTTKLLMLTSEKEKAAALIRKYNIVNSEIKYVHYTQLPEELKKVNFGFALREDNPVNQVATPTKLANYVANGVIPVYTKCVKDFYVQSMDNPYQIVIEDVNAISDQCVRNIVSKIEIPVDIQDAEEKFSNYFSEYYNSAWHAEQIALMLRRV